MDPDFQLEFGDKSTHLERVMTHELGHSAHDAHLDKLDVYKQATSWIPGAEHAEYFAQDFKNALLNPEAHAKESLDKPQAELIKAQDEMIANPGDPAKAAAFTAAMQKAVSWSTMYHHMRGNVLHGDAAENDYAGRLRDSGASDLEIERFRERAKRLSTPEQIERMGQDEFAI